MIKLDFPAFRRFAEPVNVRRIELFPIDPHPAISADPFCPPLDVATGAGNGHFNIVWILQFGPIGFAGVPNRVRRREFAVTVDLRGAGIVKAQPPMSDVAMMANPVEKLPAT